MSSAFALNSEPAPSATQPRPALSNGAIFMGTCLVLLLAPLAFGAREPWAVFALQACAAALLLAWGVRQVLAGELRIESHPLYPPMLAFLGLILAQWTAGLSAYRHRTYSLFLLYLAYAALAFLLTQTLRRYSHVRPLCWIVCGYGALVAAFALLQGIASNGKLYWMWPAEQGGNIYGPYVNHNHYAGLMEMLAPFPIALAASRFTRGKRKLLVAGIGAVMAATIFLSGSRGGMLAFVVQVAVLVALLRPRRDNWRQHAMLGGFLLIVVGLLVWLGGSELNRRLASINTEARQELSGGVRLTIARDSLRMWRARPIFGWGLGNFPVAYPQFRTFYTSSFVNEAHDDYAQMLAETGLAGVAIALWFLFLTFRRAWRKLENWTETANGVLTAAALLGVVGILVHSFLDFNLQVPANAAIFYVLCAVAASAPFEESQRRRVRSRTMILQPASMHQS